MDSSLASRKCVWTGSEAGLKESGAPLGFGSPARRVPFPASFSHRSVGSSILASLSEAGGNDLFKAASKPLPPHSPLCSDRQSERVHTSAFCKSRAKPTSYAPLITFLISIVYWPFSEAVCCCAPGRAFNSGFLRGIVLIRHGGRTSLSILSPVPGLPEPG
jgi:hypothetical protein